MFHAFPRPARAGLFHLTAVRAAGSAGRAAGWAYLGARCILIAALATSCAGRVYGYPSDVFRARVASGDERVFSLMEKRPPARFDVLGPGAHYYLARAAGRLGYQELEMSLLKLGAERETGRARIRCLETLVERLADSGDWKGALRELDALERIAASRWSTALVRLDALAALDPPGDPGPVVERLRAAYPAEAARDGGRLALALASYRAAAGDADWRTPVRELFANPAADSERLERAGELVDARPDSFDADEAARMALRRFVAARDYRKALVVALANPAAFGAKTGRAFLADRAKAFLYAREYSVGEQALAALEANARKEGVRETEFVAAFYRGRIALEAGRLSDAVARFGRSAELAASGEDRDAAFWYLAKARSRVSWSAGAAELAAGSASWAKPERFADLVDELLRAAVNARDWAGVKSLWDRLGERVDARTRARLAYVAGRAVVMGRLGPASDADGLFDLAASSVEGDRYYRIAAAWRLGRPAVEPGEPRPVPPRAADAADDLERFLAGFAEYGLSSLIREELALSGETLSDDALRRLSALCASSVGSRAVADSMRIAQLALASPTILPSRTDFEAVWPKAFDAELSAAAAAHDLPVWLLRGLARSESYFIPDVVSSAGAVGLTQLMPATAQADAKALGLASYALDDPRDNALIGAYHFKTLYRATSSFSASIFAYNAGLGRLRSWEKTLAGLPPDLFLEAIPYEETRQYGRNVIAAAVVYATLYGPEDGDAALEALLGTSSR